ncbi:MAG TPA: serine hydrolase domain-containing protein [Bryobacteraceae bacterium]|jgi:CubicO group peptidase (beta-lactamase class C family)
MSTLHRRDFARLSLALGAYVSSRAKLFGATSLDETFRAGVAKHKIPALTATVAQGDKITYTGAFGKRDSTSGVDLKMDSIFRIASMTKAITATAAMQMVDRGKVKLDDPMSKYLPELGKLQVLDGFDSGGKPKLRPPKSPILLRHLLTHTSGCVYANWNPTLTQYLKTTGTSAPPTAVAPLNPLLFDPGTRWHYGTSMDWAGKLVEKLSGLTLEQYFQKNILVPLDMKDTSFILAPEKFDRLVSSYRRQSDGTLKEDPRTQPAVPKDFNGGGGLFSTAPDYLKFTQMILRKGRGKGDDRLLRPKSVEMMMTNQIGGLSLERLKSVDPSVSADIDMGPNKKYTYGFMINMDPIPGGRSAGSLMWAGVENSFYWIDPKRNVSAVIMMQFFPFLDPQATAMLDEFEQAVYANLT